MKVSIELASNYFEVSQSHLRSNRKYSSYVLNGMFDMDKYISDQQQTQETYFEDYVEEEKQQSTSYIPSGDRVPLTASFIMQEYWAKQRTTLEIAEELNVPDSWVQKEVKRLGLGKKERGIRHKSGHKGKVMSKKERKKRQNQPHAKPIVQICPKTYITIKEYSSQGAVERHGFLRENVRRAIKTCGLSKGYLWAFKDLKEATIRVAKKREALTARKLQAAQYKRPTKRQLHNLYIVQNKTVIECAELFKCHPTTLAILAGKYGLKKRTGTVSIDELKHLRVVQGLSIEEIAKKLGYTIKTISTYLSRASVKKKTKETL